MTKHIRLAACAITNERGEILLLHRNTSKRVQWEIPGGKIEAGESEIETAAREIKEELSVSVEVGRQLLVREFTEDDYMLHCTWYRGRVATGSPVIGEPAKFDDLSYFSRAQIRAIRGKISVGAQAFIDAWLAGEFTLTNN